MKHIYMESRKIVLKNLRAGQQGTRAETRLGVTVGGGGGGGTNGENSIETYTAIFKIDSQWEFAV